MLSLQRNVLEFPPCSSSLTTSEVSGFPALAPASSFGLKCTHSSFLFPLMISTVPRLLKHIPFDAKSQLVDVHGEHEWQAPGPGDIRGACAGLNAAANHGCNCLEGGRQTQGEISEAFKYPNVSPFSLPSLSLPPLFIPSLYPFRPSKEWNRHQRFCHLWIAQGFRTRT